MMDVFSLYNMLRNNPMKLLSMRFNVPQNINDPNEIIQHLLNTGQVSQQQVNQAMQMRNNPTIQQLLHMK